LHADRDHTNSFHSSAEYTLIWNALDYPACVFPVTKVDPVLDQPKPAHDFLSEQDRVVYELCTSDFIGDLLMLTTCLWTDDSPETFKNAPVGLQLVGRSQEEEAVIAMTEIVDVALKAHKARLYDRSRS
jgi:amidase